MAKFFGNIFGRALGSIGGNTFSAAADRRGKIQTARQRVVPTNPNSTAQQKVRNRFRLVFNGIRQIPKSTYEFAFLNAVSKLPGAQSLSSILLHVAEGTTTSANYFTEPSIVPRKGIHAPNFFSTTIAGTQAVANWSTEVPAGSSASDDIVVIWFGRTNNSSLPSNFAATGGVVAQRQDGSAVISGAIDATAYGGWLAAMYARPVSVAESNYISNIKWRLHTQ